MKGLISIEIQTEIIHCLNNGMKDSKSIYTKYINFFTHCVSPYV